MTQEAKAKELSQDRGFSGIAKKDNFGRLGSAGEGQSYSRDKAQARHDLSSEGCAVMPMLATRSDALHKHGELVPHKKEWAGSYNGIARSSHTFSLGRLR
jgi:hypothetical protein